MTHSCAKHEPAYVCYKLCGCRCSTCGRTAYEYNRHRNRQIAYGRWQPYVDAEPVREHVRWLQSCGLGWKRVARLAGLDTSVLWKLLYGDPSRGMAPSKRVRPRTAERVLQVMPTAVADRAYIDAAATWRHIDGLLERGWTKAAISKQIGQDGRALQLSRSKVTARHAKTIRDLDRKYPGPAPEWARRQPGGHAKKKRERGKAA